MIHQYETKDTLRSNSYLALGQRRPRTSSPKPAHSRPENSRAVIFNGVGSRTAADQRFCPCVAIGDAGSTISITAATTQRRRLARLVASAKFCLVTRVVDTRGIERLFHSTYACEGLCAQFELELISQEVTELSRAPVSNAHLMDIDSLHPACLVNTATLTHTHNIGTGTAATIAGHV